MRALTWHGKHDVRVDTVDDPEIVNPRDAIIRITATAICGSDLHLYDGYIPTMEKGDILGHDPHLRVGRELLARPGEVDVVDVAARAVAHHRHEGRILVVRAQQLRFTRANFRQPQHQLAGIIRIALLIARPTGRKHVLSRLPLLQREQRGLLGGIE